MVAGLPQLLGYRLGTADTPQMGHHVPLRGVQFGPRLSPSLVQLGG